MKRTCAVFIAVLLILMSTSCTSINNPEDTGFKIYRSNANNDTLLWEYLSDVEKTDIAGALAALSSEPKENGMYKIIPDGVEILSWYFGQDGQLIIDFGGMYSNMDTVAELLMRAGIVKTLCQLDEVEYVEFYVEGQPLTLEGGKVVHLMTAHDFIDNTGTDTQFAQSVNMTVYFADETGTMMSESILRVEYDGQNPLEEIVLYELTEGPLENRKDLFPVIPEGTVVNKISSKDGICYVDFNSNFLNGREGVSNEVVLYSVVNSLVEISYITKVVISVDGSPLKNYGDMQISGILGRRPELITNEKAGELTE